MLIILRFGHKIFYHNSSYAWYMCISSWCFRLCRLIFQVKIVKLLYSIFWVLQYISLITFSLLNEYCKILLISFPVSLVALNWLKERFFIIMFYAWRLVKRKLIFNTNTFSVDSEKTSVKVVLFQYAFLSRGYKPRRLYTPSRPLYKVDSCVRSTLEVKHSLRRQF